MFTRSILIPSLVACAIAAPIMFSQVNKPPAPTGQTAQAPWQQVGHTNNGNSQTFLPRAQSLGSANMNSFRKASSVTSQTAPMGNPIFGTRNSVILPTNPAAAVPVNPNVQVFPARGFAAGSSLPSITEPDWATMTPDFGATQTIVLPGNAEGPDYSAAPLEFIPVMNFEEIFRFDTDPGWVKSRWNRVSTSPGDLGLHGLRVALVTGTNSWDLHGSLTYYFDGNQQIQRITFRGWTGSATRLINLLTQKYEFKTQPTQCAGFYLAENRRNATGGLLMKHPTVIYTENPVQQIALVLEINNPSGKSTLSDDFKSLIAGSQNGG